MLSLTTFFTNIDMRVTTRMIASGDLNLYSNDELAEQLNDEFREAVMPVTVFIGMEAVIGFFGNLLVIYVFFFHYHVCNFRNFVLCMAFVDFTSTLTTMPGEIVTQLYWYVYPSRFVCKIKSFFNVFTVTAEALCLLTIALDRYRKVCAPFRWQIRHKMAIILCGVIYVLAFILALPVAFFWGIMHPKHRYKNQTIITTICEKDEQFKGTDHPFRYAVVVESIISICLILMFILYLFVARKLVNRKHNVCVETTKHVITALSTTHPGDSSEVNNMNEYELNSKQENTDAGASSDIYRNAQESQSNDISSDCGLKTNREDSTRVGSMPPVRGTSSECRSISKLGNSAKNALTKSLKNNKCRKFGIRVRRKTKIMVILTVAFIITTILYLTLLSFIAEDFLQDMSAGEKTGYFFFFRLFFMNHVINPIIYGFLDPHFKKEMVRLKQMFCGN